MQRDEDNAGRADVAHASQIRGVPVGIVALADADAARAARQVTRHAARGAAPDPLDGIAARIRAEGRAELAFDEPVLVAALDLRETDAPAFEALLRELKAARVGVTRWNVALAERARARKRAAKAEERTTARQEAERRRMERAARREVERAEREATRAQAATDLAAHYREADDGNGGTFTMTPEQTVVETVGRRGEVERTVLMRGSVLVETDTREWLSPNAAPRRLRGLSIACCGDAAPHKGDVPAAAWALGQWLETIVPARACVPADRKLRARLLDAVVACSTPREVDRYAFTGRVCSGGRSIHVHAGGAVDERGDVDGVEVSLQAPADLYRFPSVPEGEDRLHAARAMVDLLSAEPATLFVPGVALAARSMMGAPRVAMHVVGGKGVGKTTSCRLIASLFGAAMARTSPASWKSDSAIAINAKSAIIGDAVLLVEDLQPDDASHRKTDDVLRPYFDGLAASKGKREGGMRTTPAPRCAFLSTGEVRLRGHSLSSRAVTVCLNERPRFDLERLTRYAREGELAGAMALMVRWYSPRYDENLPRLDVLEREAARRWGLGEDGRGADLLGALALGMDETLAFLAPGGLLPGGVLDTSEVAAHRARAESALKAALRTYDDAVGDEDPARLFCDTLGEVLRAGRAHIAGIGKNSCLGTPRHPASMGWREDRLEWRPQGPRIGYDHIESRRHEVWLDPGPAFEAAADRARAVGRPFAVDREGVGRALRAAGVLARTDKDGPTTVQVRLGAGTRARVWVLRSASLGYDPDDPT